MKLPQYNFVLIKKINITKKYKLVNVKIVRHEKRKGCYGGRIV